MGGRLIIRRRPAWERVAPATLMLETYSEPIRAVATSALRDAQRTLLARAEADLPLLTLKTDCLPVHVAVACLMRRRPRVVLRTLNPLSPNRVFVQVADVMPEVCLITNSVVVITILPEFAGQLTFEVQSAWHNGA